jgi:hypothetical protein
MANPPRLKPPGAGIPAYQRVVAKTILIPLYLRRHPWDSIPPLLERQTDAFARDFERERARGGDARLTKRVLIKPAPGLEDDSRYWSLAMVIDHLRRVNARMIEVITALTTASPLPDGPTLIPDFKPDPASASGVLAPYRETTARLARLIAATPPEARNAPGTAPHPWFGPLTVRTWAPFCAMHQGIHATQWERILEGLGRE